MTRIHSENEGLNPKQSPALRAKPVSGVYASNPKYRMILAHFIGKKKWQIDARSLRRVEAFPNRKRPRPGILRPAAIRRIQRRATCRSSVRAIPGPAAEPPLSYKFRACNDKRDPSGET